MTLYILDTDTLSLFQRGHPAVEVRCNACPSDQQTMRLGVGNMGLRIAATVLEVGGILVTRNTRDFSRIPGLPLEDWSV